MTGRQETTASDQVPSQLAAISEVAAHHRPQAKEPREFAITAIIPVYNRFESVPRAIDSILRQTYQPEEILLVDDSSKTRLEDFLREKGYLDKVRVCRSEKNLGSSEARNYGARMATTEWVAYLDSDDLWYDWCLERLTDHLRKTPDCDGVDGKLLCKTKTGDLIYGEERNDRLTLRDAVTNNQIFNQAFLVKRKVIVDVGYDGRVAFFDDSALTLRMAAHNVKIDHLFGEPLAIHHRLGDNYSTGRRKMMRSAFKILWLYRHEYRREFGPGAMLFQSGRIIHLLGRRIRKVGIVFRAAGKVIQACVPWAPRIGQI